ncbi:MAG: NUDIX domain-containing protein [Bacteroidia bacterium]|nr:NUDIX domain-containing protein [Bacteroidia bacterium]MDW8347241.1 NUDIX domain-containing protein [Bacteroidia bacterium]
MKQSLEHALKFKQWKATLEKNGIQFNNIQPLHLIHKPNGELIFALLNIDAQDEQGQKLLPIVLLRGNFVSVLTCFISQETGKKFLLLVKQYRVSNGEISYEHPAGMCDSENDPYKVAIKEVEEETGLMLKKENLVLLNKKMYYTSPGLLDEGGYFFYCEITLPQSEIDQYQDKKTGDLNEHEHIQTCVVPIEDAPKLMTNIPALLNYYLYIQAQQG